MLNSIEGLISVKFFYRNGKIFQHFIFENKKNVTKYVRDNRFLINAKFEKKIKQHSLSSKDEYQFLNRRDENDRIVLEFEIIEEPEEKPENYYFKIAGFASPRPSCEFCKFRNDKENGFFYCEYKEKTFGHYLKNCKFFREKKGLFKT